MSKINPVELFESLENVRKIIVSTEIAHSGSSTGATKFTVTRKVEIFPADFHFDKKGIIAFDALLKSHGLECDLEMNEYRKAIFTIKEVEYHREDGTLDYLHFPSQGDDVENEK